MEKDDVFFGTVLSFVLGILYGSFFEVVPREYLFLVGAGAIMLAVVFRKKEPLFLGLFFLSWCFGGSSAFEERVRFESLPILTGAVSGEVRVLNDPEERDTYRRTVVAFERCDEGECPEEYILWQAPLSFFGEAGTRIAFSCHLELPKNFIETFDYRMFLAKEGIGYVCFRPNRAEMLFPDREASLRALLYRPKHIFEEALSQSIPEPEAGLAKGLLLGGDAYLPQSLKEAFTAIGLSHMIAVSGYNITLIAELFLVLGLFFGLYRRQAVFAALVGIFFFIFMIGLPASAVRAGAMAGIVFMAFQTGRLAQPVNALLFALGIMLLPSPLLLRYDVGFELSFLATLGILLLMPYFEEYGPRQGVIRKVTEVLFLTVAVELFVLPIILLLFHTVSPLILVGNFLMLLVPGAMAASFLAALCFLIFPGFQLLLVPWAYGFLRGITFSVEWLARIPHLAFSSHQFGVWHLVLWYVILAFALFALQKYTRRSWTVYET